MQTTENKCLPIETAPKDGTTILLFIPDLGWRPAEWWDKDFDGDPGWVSPVTASIRYVDAVYWMEEPEWPN